MNTLTPNCQVKSHFFKVIQCSQMAEVKKDIESLIKVITELLTRRLEITLKPHWPISSSEDQLVNPYDLFAVNPKYILCLGQHPQFHCTV